MTLPHCLIAVSAALVLLSAHAAADDEAPTTGTIEANGVKIRYYVQGKGEPVILIHGWLASAALNWSLPGTTRLLAQDWKVISLDVRGHGLSDKPTSEDTYGPELVEDVLRIMDHLKIPKAHIVGYSMGGMITANFMAKHPDRVLSGTLGGMGWLKKGSAGQLGFTQVARGKADAGPVLLCGRSMAKLALSEDEIASIRVPVKVLVGEQDNLIKRLYVEPLMAARKDWPVTEIKGANHLTCIFKQQFQEELVAWLRKNRQ